MNFRQKLFYQNNNYFLERKCRGNYVLLFFFPQKHTVNVNVHNTFAQKSCYCNFDEIEARNPSIDQNTLKNSKKSNCMISQNSAQSSNHRSLPGTDLYLHLHQDHSLQVTLLETDSIRRRRGRNRLNE